MMFQQARDEVVSTCIKLADKGYLAGTGGNVALRVDDDHFLVTPSSMDYYAMRPGDICVMRMTDVVQIEGEKGPSVEASLHAKVLTARPDCKASLHTHQPIAGAFSLLATDLKVEDPDAIALLGERIPCASYAPSGTGWLAKRVGQAFSGSNHACLMRSHGIVCVGTDIQQAIDRIIALEAACAAFFQNASADGPPLQAETAALIEQALTSISQRQNQETTA